MCSAAGREDDTESESLADAARYESTPISQRGMGYGSLARAVYAFEVGSLSWL